MFRRCCIFLLVLFILVSQPVQADTLHNKLNNYQNQLKTLNHTLDTQKQQENTAVQQALSLQSSIDVLQNSMHQNNVAIEQHQKKITTFKNEQLTLETRQQENIRVLGDYLRAQYEAGDDFYLSWFFNWLFDAKSLEDFLGRVEYTQSITNAYKELGDQINADVNAVQTKREAEQEETEKLTKAIQSQHQMENSLNITLTKQKETINSLSVSKRQTVLAQAKVQNNINDTEELIKQQELEAELAAKNPQQQAAQKEADKSNAKIINPVHISASTAKLLDFAASFVGTPYVWGGTTPRPGFDCSGYVQYVYTHFGINLYRVSEDQYEEGQSVQQNDLEPGDLVFFSTYASGASHVGIYVGNRMMIDSSNHGVAYDSLDQSYWAARYLGARRVIQQ